MSVDISGTSSKSMVGMVIALVIMVAFGAIVMAQVQQAVNNMNITDTNAQNTINTVFSNAWIAFTILAIMVIIIVAWALIKMF